MRTGVANTASVIAAFRKLGVRAALASTPDEALRSARLVVPGVGSFGAIMDSLSDHGLVDALRDRIASGEPTLAICLGMQILAERSEESPGVAGLGVIGGSIERFDEPVLRVPQLGWNQVTPDGTCETLRSGAAYFANSFRLTQAPDGWGVATTQYGSRFISAIERGPVLACQFHPELSGAWGLSLLRRWLVRAGAEAVAS